MAVRLTETPLFLYRIGRSPDPLIFPPLAFSGSGRYDDPHRRCSSLYAALDRRAVFMETLDAFRPDLAALADRNANLSVPTLAKVESAQGVVPARYLQRRIVRFCVGAGQRWLDVRAPETHAVLRDELRTQLAEIGFGPRFVLGDLLANDHRMTQIVAGWAIDHAFHGIAYFSCHDPNLTCWAIFQGAAIFSLEPAQPLAPADPDLLAVAGLWNLQLPGSS